MLAAVPLIITAAYTNLPLRKGLHVLSILISLAAVAAVARHIVQDVN